MVELECKIDGRSYDLIKDCLVYQLISRDFSTKVGDTRVINGKLFYANLVEPETKMMKKTNKVYWCMYNLPVNQEKGFVEVDKFFQSIYE